MTTPKELKPGDSCPNCQSALKPMLVPSAEQRKRADDRENREPLPPFYDTASEAQRAELGALYRCHTCGYTTRFHEAAPAHA